MPGTEACLLIIYVIPSLSAHPKQVHPPDLHALLQEAFTDRALSVSLSSCHQAQTLGPHGSGGPFLGGQVKPVGVRHVEYA